MKRYKIGIISDIHARAAPLQQALDIFSREAVDDIYCAGDIAGYYEELPACIDLLQQAHCKTIIGNHDQDYLDKHNAEDTLEVRYLLSLASTASFTLAHKKIYMVHAEPPTASHGGIKLLDQQGEVIEERLHNWTRQLQDIKQDILIVGHTHQVFALQLGDVFVINPGSTAFNHSCMILELPELRVRTYVLEDTPIIKCWNFSMLHRSGSPYPSGD
jgi:putative phosphoesterase